MVSSGEQVFDTSYKPTNTDFTNPKFNTGVNGTDNGTVNTDYNIENSLLDFLNLSDSFNSPSPCLQVLPDSPKHTVPNPIDARRFIATNDLFPTEPTTSVSLQTSTPATHPRLLTSLRGVAQPYRQHRFQCKRKRKI